MNIHSFFTERRRAGRVTVDEWRVELSESRGIARKH